MGGRHRVLSNQRVLRQDLLVLVVSSDLLEEGSMIRPLIQGRGSRRGDVDVNDQCVSQCTLEMQRCGVMAWLPLL